MSETRQEGQEPAFTSKMVTFPSLEVVQTSFQRGLSLETPAWCPSLAMAMEETRPSWTCQVRMQVPVSTSFMATKPSLLPDRVRSLHRQQEKIELVWPASCHLRGYRMSSDP